MALDDLHVRGGHQPDAGACSSQLIQEAYGVEPALIERIAC